jgi:nucleolysin TIA-1/TIAR
LREAFLAFGEITDVKIMKDPQTHAHKGYGFISFVNKVDAETAIASMNGQWLGTRKIRTNWATRKVQPGSGINNNDMTSGGGGGSNSNNSGTNGSGGVGGQLNRHSQKLDYNEVWNRSSDNNTTVYCGGINGITEDLIRNTFSQFGHIIAIHPFPDRGYAFIRFTTKESACSAICGINGIDINGCQAKCSWGKENIDITNSTFNALAAVNNAAAAAAANASLAQAQTSNNVWTTAVQQNPNWAAAAAANYQWTAAGYAAGPPPPNAAPNNMNYWQQYNTGFQK